MTGLLPGKKLRAMAALIAAYAIALQAVFTMLAPLQVQADGSVTVYCSGGGARPGSDEPGVPARAGQLECVFCGACASGLAVLPGEAVPAYAVLALPAERTRGALVFRPHDSGLRDGPARAPPLTV